MSNVEQEVRQVVDSFMKSGELFTALDVSNKVKMALPFARHSEVRDIVRDLFATVMQPASWARTPIDVTLPDGSVREALLYHPLSDSWDLDEKYDAQKRAQAAVKPGQVPVAAPVVPSATVGSNGTVTVTSPVPVTVTAPSVTVLAAKDKWAALFDSQPSLFPRK